jgi:hypothetical protein
MVDALLVFSPLQEICFFVLRAPYLDQIGVAPLLRRRLIGLQRFFLCWFSQVRLLTSSLAFRVALSALRQPLQPAGPPSLPSSFDKSSNSCQASHVASLRTYLLSVCLYEFLIRKNFRKTSSAVAYLVLLFIFTKN